MEFPHTFITTGIGSFPHRDGKEASRLIFENFPTLPFWPQLPKRSFLEGMVVQFSEGFPSLKWSEAEQRVWVDTGQGFDKEIEKFYGWLDQGDLEPFRITDDFANGLRILKDLASEEHQREAKYVKGQITGPLTFGLTLNDPERKPIFYDPTLRDILIKHLSLKARWMEKKLNDLMPETPSIIFFDEPSLSSFGSAFSSLNREDVIHSLNECLGAIKGLKGIHCCGNTDWSLLLEMDIDILSFDAYGYAETLSLYPKALKKFLERGGILAWGIVPTSEAILKEDSQSLVKRFTDGMKSFTEKGMDHGLLQRAIITPSCGMGSLPMPLAERICQVTSEVSKRLKETKHGL